eukprot:6211679-Alexandrium_andersonii.AAC.1
MGGPASPLLWALAYDPIVVATADTARSPTPTYVGDLSATLGASLRRWSSPIFSSWPAALRGC